MPAVKSRPQGDSDRPSATQALPPVAYLVGRYPAISHTFIRREVAALRERGLEIEMFSIWPTPGEELLSDADRDKAHRTVDIATSAEQLSALFRRYGPGCDGTGVVSAA